MIPAIWNFFRRWGLRFQALFLGIWNGMRRFFGRAVNTMAVGAIAILVLLAPGALLGWIGYATDTEWLVEVGKFAVALGGMIAALAMAVFYFKIGVVTTHILVGLDGVLEFLSGGRIKNFFSKETGMNIRHDMLNAFAWATVFILWCSIVPVWKTPVAIPLGLTFCLFFAFASARSWTFVEKPIGKFVVFSLLLVAFGFHTVNVALRGAASEWISTRADILAADIETDISADEGREDILEVREEFVEARSNLRVREYRRLATRRIALMAKRNARTLTDAEREELKRATLRMQELERGPAPSERATSSDDPDIVGAASGSNSPPSSGGGSAVLTAGRSLAAWVGSNWGLLVIAALSAFLLIMLIIGLATGRNWLAGSAFVALLLLGLIGAGTWMYQGSNSGAVNTQPIVRHESPVRERRAIAKRAKCRPGLRAEIEDIGRNLDALAGQ